MCFDYIQNSVCNIGSNTVNLHYLNLKTMKHKIDKQVATISF